MARAVASDHLSVFRFHVEAIGTFGQQFLKGNTPQSGFASVSLPEPSVEVIDYAEGQHNWWKKIPGQVAFDTITLRRGVARRDAAFWNWLSTVILGTGSFRATVEIKHYSRLLPGSVEAAAVSAGAGNAFGNAILGSFPRSGQIPVDTTPARIYRLHEAWPTRCKLASDLDASSGDVAVAELELAYEHLDLDVIE
jgi:phage tail-like protein